MKKYIDWTWLFLILTTVPFVKDTFYEYYCLLTRIAFSIRRTIFYRSNYIIDFNFVESISYLPHKDLCVSVVYAYVYARKECKNVMQFISNAKPVQTSTISRNLNLHFLWREIKCDSDGNALLNIFQKSSHQSSFTLFNQFNLFPLGIFQYSFPIFFSFMIIKFLVFTECSFISNKPTKNLTTFSASPKISDRHCKLC